VPALGCQDSGAVRLRYTVSPARARKSPARRRWGRPGHQAQVAGQRLPTERSCLQREAEDRSVVNQRVAAARLTAGYLESESGCLRCKRRGCFVCTSCVMDALPGQCLRRTPDTNPLVAAIFRIKRLLREHYSATCQRRRRPGHACPWPCKRMSLDTPPGSAPDGGGAPTASKTADSSAPTTPTPSSDNHRADLRLG
jgi:hypothetical protein